MQHVLAFRGLFDDVGHVYSPTSVGAALLDVLATKNVHVRTVETGNMITPTLRKSTRNLIIISYQLFNLPLIHSILDRISEELRLLA